MNVVKNVDYVLIDVQRPTDEQYIPQYVTLKEVSHQVESVDIIHEN